MSQGLIKLAGISIATRLCLGMLPMLVGVVISCSDDDSNNAVNSSNPGTFEDLLRKLDGRLQEAVAQGFVEHGDKQLFLNNVASTSDAARAGYLIQTDSASITISAYPDGAQWTASLDSGTTILRGLRRIPLQDLKKNELVLVTAGSGRAVAVKGYGVPHP